MILRTGFTLVPNSFIFGKRMVHLSTTAVNEIKRLRLKQQNPDVLFRLQVQSGGCSGLFYDLKFDQVKPGDQLFDCNSIAVVVDAQSLIYISELTIDYSEDLMGGGFRFHNLAATTFCGCGNSFSINASPT